MREAAATVYGATMLHPEMSLAVTVFTAVLLAVVALVLLIVCVNVANLVLARAAGATARSPSGSRWARAADVSSGSC